MFDKTANGGHPNGMYWLNHQHKLCFFGIPKNASTSIRNLFGMNPHHGYLQERKDLSGYKKFTVLRDPYSRIMSSYNEMLKLRTDTGTADITRKLPFFNIQDKQKRFEQYLIDIEENLYDPHIQTQLYFVVDVPIEQYLVFERINDDFKSKLGININLPQHNSSKLKYKVTDVVKEQVEKIYAKDLKLHNMYK